MSFRYNIIGLDPKLKPREIKANGMDFANSIALLYYPEGTYTIESLDYKDNGDHICEALSEYEDYGPQGPGRYCLECESLIDNTKDK